MKKARADGSDDAKAFIDREAANEFAALREMKVILKELKDKVELEDTLNMEVAIFDLRARRERHHSRDDAAAGNSIQKEHTAWRRLGWYTRKSHASSQ